MNKLDVENIFIDLDGTALTSNKIISRQTIDIIKDLRRNNINVFVATGRPPYMIKNELKELNVNENVICVNGGMIINTNENNLIHINKLDISSSRKIEKFLKTEKIPYLIYTDKLIYYNCDSNNEWIQFLKKVILSLSNDQKWDLIKMDKSFSLESHNIVKFIVPTYGLKHELLDSLNNLLKENKELFTLVESQENILDIIPPNSSKGEGIKYLAKLLSLNLNKTLAFGDANNDISMFQVVKYSVAMGNAVKELKKIATFVTLNNDNNGISKFIKDKVL